MLQFPASLLSLLILHLELWSVSAKRLPKYTTDADNNIVNNYNERYTVNLTVAGTTVNVMLDTGSTDAWVAPIGGISGSFNDTGAFATIYYGDGSNFINGSVGLAPVEIAGFSIPQQACINVTNSVGEESDVSSGVFGLVGLGFDGPRGSIPAALTAAGYNGTDVGKAVLSSIYAQNPSSGRFFSFSLSRVGDVQDSADASLVISGYDDNTPADSGRWSVLTEGISVGGSDIEWTSYESKLPKGQTAVLFDTGTTNFLVSAKGLTTPQLRDAIYSAVPGAVLAKNSSIPNLQFSEDEDVGQQFPIHPLDVTDMGFIVGPDGKNYTVCTGSITNGGSILGPGLDALYGDSFLRNVYSVFSFGNETTPPNVQLLSDTATDAAAADFASVRAELLQDSPPELSPQDIIKLFDGGASSSASSPATAVSTATSVTATSVTATSVPGGSDDLVGSSKASVNLAASDSGSTVDKYGAIIVGLLAANLIIMLVVAFFSVMNFVRNGRTTGPTRAVNAAYAPVKLREDAPRSSFSTTDHAAYSD
ncbi:aspartic peptidase domain-containing protein [Mycena alexandri]|uniref:Aspartic peptidase domain-containing protein n=1 Tax=Mycena alexandri TaxID=1745969 RepID=A0AAD6T8T2_9AGAR|nr:aspartic peptidase domain-containing protein [Mycena alexandri]